MKLILGVAGLFLILAGCIYKDERGPWKLILKDGTVFNCHALRNDVYYKGDVLCFSEYYKVHVDSKNIKEKNRVY